MTLDENGEVNISNYARPALEVIGKCFRNISESLNLWLTNCKGAVHRTHHDFIYIPFEDDSFYAGMKIPKNILAALLQELPEKELIPCEYINRKTLKWEKSEILSFELLNNWRDGASSRYLYRT